MPKDVGLAPMFMFKFNNEFQDFDFMTSLDSPFAITNYLQAYQAEATAKGLCVAIQVSLVAPEFIFGPQVEGEGEPEDDGETDQS
jgi:hypothetical protein